MSKTLQKHYARILQQWPVDGMRAVRFQDAMRRRMANNFLEGRDPTDASTAHSLGDKAELEQMNALYSLLENRYSQTYKASDDLLRPTSNPTYYTALAKEIELSPNRTWWQNLWLSWSRRIRFK